MRFSKFLTTGLCLGFLGAAALKSEATYLLEFVPANQTVNLGSTASVDIFVEDIGADSPAIGAFFFFVSPKHQKKVWKEKNTSLEIQKLSQGQKKGRISSRYIFVVAY